MTQRYIYGEEPPEEEGSIVGKALGQLGSAFSMIPGVDPALKVLDFFGETGGGVLSATLRGKGLDVLGIGEQRAEDSYLGIDEQDDIWNRLRKTRAWQRDRKSAFWGEKFLAEVVGDPLTYLPIGTAFKWGRHGVRSFRGARAMNQAVRAGTSPAGGGMVRVALSPQISADEMRYAAGFRKGRVRFDLPSPTNSTQFYGQRHRELRLFAEDLIRRGNTDANPELIARGESILDDILEEPASYVRDILERNGFKDVEITTSRYGEVGPTSIGPRGVTGVGTPDISSVVKPTISITANVADDKVDDFIRLLGDVADVDFGRTSMIVHQGLKKGADKTFREVKHKAKKGAAPEGADYAVAPMVSMMTKGGKVLSHSELNNIQDAINKLSAPAGEGHFTPSGLFIAGGEDEPLNLLGFSVRQDGKGIDLIHTAGLDDKATKALGKTETIGVNKNIKVQSKEEAGQRFIESVKRLKEVMDDPEEYGGKLAGIFDKYEVDVRAVRHYGRRGAGDTTDRFTSSYDKGRRYHDAKRGETAGEKAGLSRKARRAAGRRNSSNGNNV